MGVYLAVVDPGGSQGPWPPSSNFSPFAYENINQNKTFGPPAPDIGS